MCVCDTPQNSILFMKTLHKRQVLWYLKVKSDIFVGKEYGTIKSLFHIKWAFAISRASFAQPVQSLQVHALNSFNLTSKLTKYESFLMVNPILERCNRCTYSVMVAKYIYIPRKDIVSNIKGNNTICYM